jgi:HSP20 family protein
MREMEELFGDFFGSPLDIIDRADGYTVKAAMPGFKPEEVEVSLADGVLDIRAQRKQESESKDGGYLRRELSIGNYARSVQLPDGIKEGDIKASFENGMLTIEIPKVPAPKPVKIPISGRSEKQLVGANSEK